MLPPYPFTGVASAEDGVRIVRFTGTVKREPAISVNCSVNEFSNATALPSPVREIVPSALWPGATLLGNVTLNQSPLVETRERSRLSSETFLIVNFAWSTLLSPNWERSILYGEMMTG